MLIDSLDKLQLIVYLWFIIIIMIIEDKLIEEDIMEINKNTLKEIRTQLDNVLKNHNIKGLNIELGNCSFDNIEATFKLKVTIEGGETKEEQNLKDMAKLMNLDLTIIHPTWKIVGYRSKARTKPFLAVKHSNPKQKYILGVEHVKDMFAKKENV